MKKTILYSSHNMEEVEKICDRVIILDKGKILASGSPEGLKELVKIEETISVEILKLLMDFGGNPNSVTKGVNKNGEYSFPFRQTALEAASRNGNIAKIKLLLNYGADVNFTPDRDYDTDPLLEALETENMRAALCLLENGAKFDKEYINPFDKEKETILFILRKIDLQLNSDEYKYKLKIINFLKKKGLDYYNEPIPDFMIERIKRLHPDDWQEKYCSILSVSLTNIKFYFI